MLDFGFIFSSVKDWLKLRGRGRENRKGGEGYCFRCVFFLCLDFNRVNVKRFFSLLEVNKWWLYYFFFESGRDYVNILG